MGRAPSGTQTVRRGIRRGASSCREIPWIAVDR